MSTKYEELYRATPHALGEANPDVIAFFEGREPLRALDIGCGQGRDALAIARLGHQVHGVDISPAGIAQMRDEAAEDGLPVSGHVADIRSYAPDTAYDVLLIDRTLHMLPDEAERIAVFTRLLTALKRSGWLLLLDEPSNMAGFAAALDRDAATWRRLSAGRQREGRRPVTGILFAQRVE